MGKTYFVTGTDTDAGKTFVSVALLHRAKEEGLTTAAIKPVAAGCEETEDGLRNGDALALSEAMTFNLPYPEVNPVAVEPPIAPHIAAEDSDILISAPVLADHCRKTMARNADFTLIEGAGGWRVPLNREEAFSDLPRLLDIPVILVVGMKLGCINHAMLTYEAICRDRLNIAGWVANQIDPEMSRKEDNLETLKQLIKAPFLGYVPWLDDEDQMFACAGLTLPA
ncbi:dethiobiotin synthase [Spongorhabdus nitratireducens]